MHVIDKMPPPEVKQRIEDSAASMVGKIQARMQEKAAGVDIKKTLAPLTGVLRFFAELDQECQANMKSRAADKEAIDWTLALFRCTQWPALAAEHIREKTHAGEPVSAVVSNWLITGLEKNSTAEATEALRLNTCSAYHREVRSRWLAALLAILETIFSLPQACAEAVARDSGFSGVIGLGTFVCADQPMPIHEVRQARRDFKHIYEGVRETTIRHKSKPYAPAAALLALLVTGSRNTPPQKADRAFNEYMERGWDLDGESFGLVAMEQVFAINEKAHRHVRIESLFEQIVGGPNRARLLLWSDIVSKM